MATITGAGPEATPRRRRPWRWVLVTLLVLAVIAGVDAYLNAPRPGPRMDPASTGSDGAHALVELLRRAGVDVVVANNLADVESAARPDTLILVAESQYLTDTLCWTGWTTSPGPAAGGTGGTGPRGAAARRTGVQGRRF